VSAFLSRAQFELIAKPLFPALFEMCAKIVGREWAQYCYDNALECAWQAADRLSAFPTPEEFSRFVSRYVRSTCREHLRGIIGTGDYLMPPDDVLRIAEQIGVDSTLALPDISSLYYAALKDEFDDLLQRTTLTSLQEMCLRSWRDGCPQEQIAAYIGISQEMVCKHIAAAVAKIRNVRFQQEDTLNSNIEHFFWMCIHEVNRTIYRKPSHPQKKTRRRRVRITAHKKTKLPEGVTIPLLSQ